LSNQVKQLLESQAKLLQSVQTATAQQRMSAAQGPSTSLSTVSISGAAPMHEQAEVQTEEEQQQQGGQGDTVGPGSGAFAADSLTSRAQDVPQLFTNPDQQPQQQQLQDLQEAKDWHHQQQHRQQLESGSTGKQPLCWQKTSPDGPSAACPTRGACSTAEEGSSTPAAAADDSSSHGADLPSQLVGCSSPSAACVSVTPQTQQISRGDAPDVPAAGSTVRPIRSPGRVTGATHGLSLSSSQLQKQVQEQQVVVEEQAATIKELKTVVSGNGLCYLLTMPDCMTPAACT
jgi:hypothetical protein